MAKSRMTERLRLMVVERYDGTCALCHGPGHEVDHIIPRSRFGSKRVAEQEDISNLQLLCLKCHYGKHHGNLVIS